MSLNTAHNGDNIYIHMGEQIILYVQNVTIEFSNMPAPEFKGAKSGKMYLTTHRLIFHNNSKKDPMITFSFPFVALSNLGLEQPIFGANYITGIVEAQQNGKWTGQAKFKMTFKSGGAIEFGQSIMHLAKFAKNYQPQGPPPAYMDPTGPYHPAPPPAYHADPSGYYGWMPPTHVFPSAPPANTVYMVDVPPPYTGIFGPQQQTQNPYAGASCPPPQPQGPVIVAKMSEKPGKNNENQKDVSQSPTRRSQNSTKPIAAAVDPNSDASAITDPKVAQEPETIQILNSKDTEKEAAKILARDGHSEDVLSQVNTSSHPVQMSPRVSFPSAGYADPPSLFIAPPHLRVATPSCPLNHPWAVPDDGRPSHGFWPQAHSPRDVRPPWPQATSSEPLHPVHSYAASRRRRNREGPENALRVTPGGQSDAQSSPYLGVFSEENSPLRLPRRDTENPTSGLAEADELPSGVAPQRPITIAPGSAPIPRGYFPIGPPPEGSVEPRDKN